MNSCDGETKCNRDKILVLFDIDGTLTPARRPIEDEMDTFLQTLRSRVTVGLVGGSDLNKIAEQTMSPSKRTCSSVDPIQDCVTKFDYVFAENGLVAYKNGRLLATQSLVNYLGEEKLQRFINFCLAYMSSLQLPVKRGNFIEFRNGMINVSPVGRSCNQEERMQFNAFDQEHKIRQRFIEKLEQRFGPQSDDPIDLVYSIGGQISFDAFPKGWDKTFCLKMIDQTFEKVYFFGDKTQPGGNDHEIFIDSRTIGHSVSCPSDTLTQLKNLAI